MKSSKSTTYLAGDGRAVARLLATCLLGVAGFAVAAAPVGPAPVDAEAVPLEVVRRNLVDDPNLLAKVAARNGMTPSRFMGQEEGRILQMTRAYIAECNMGRASARCPVVSGAISKGQP